MLIDLVRAGAARTPERALLLTHDGELTYARAAAEAEAIARQLAVRGVERFGIIAQDPTRVLLALVASSAAGCEACVYPQRGTDPAHLAARLQHEVLADDAALAGWADEGAAAPSPALPPDPPCPVLVLTSGTTGEPKGTRHDWNRLVAAARPDPSPGSRWLLAYNLNQFAGLQVLVHVLASGATLVAPRTIQPRDAVEAMAQHGVTHASATPTFWRFVSHVIGERGTEDLPLEQITLGGEAVPSSVLETVRDLFPRARVSQVYASSEFGSSVSVRDGLPGLPLTVLDRAPDAPVAFRIVDGELQARSRVGMLGYHGEPDLTGDWRGTGDLVEVRDGRIHFVGRASDVINVGGVKVHPLPVEAAVEAVPGVIAARAYARANPVTNQIVAVDVVAAPDTSTDELKERIRSACATLPTAAQPRRIRFVEAIDQREHKVVRSAEDR